MLVSIGIFAHNEEQQIATTLHSLLSQSIFEAGVQERIGIERLEVICLPNGCTDNTSQVAEDVLGKAERPRAVMSVVSLEAAGKSRTWNRFVHDLSDRSARYLVLMDADIEFGSADVIESLVTCLRERAGAVVSVDTTVKHYAKPGTTTTWVQRLSLAASSQKVFNQEIAGSLYCGRAAELRKIHMPLNLPVEDGFLKAMILTNGFTASEGKELIVRAPGVCHYFEPSPGLGGFLRHEKRLVVGSVINFWLYSLLWEQGKKGHVGEFIRAQNISDPHWLERLARSQREKRKWLIPSHFILWRIAPLKAQPWRTAVRKMPIAVAATLLMLIVCVFANRVLRQPDATEFW